MLEICRCHFIMITEAFGLVVLNPVLPPGDEHAAGDDHRGGHEGQRVGDPVPDPPARKRGPDDGRTVERGDDKGGGPRSNERRCNRSDTVTPAWLFSSLETFCPELPSIWLSDQNTGRKTS
jgi:hypothetical protein